MLDLAEIGTSDHMQSIPILYIKIQQTLLLEFEWFGVVRVNDLHIVH